jgi:hypothetical protein
MRDANVGLVEASMSLERPHAVREGEEFSPPFFATGDHIASGAVDVMAPTMARINPATMADFSSMRLRT